VSEPANLRKLELECLRLETDCMELAGAVDSPCLKSLFITMAKEWSTLAVWGLEHGWRISRQRAPPAPVGEYYWP
jgi:hypothetical protein